MKKISLLLVYGVVLISCNNDKKTKTINHEVKKSLKVLNANIHNSKRNLTEQIKGQWGPLNDTNSSFNISTSEIFYYDTQTAYKYLLFGNSIKVKYNNYDYDGELKMIGEDTLVMIGKDKFKGDRDTLHRIR